MKLMITYLGLFLFVVGSTQAQAIKGTYAIKNMQTGMLLRVKDANGKNGTPLVAYNPQNWKCMTWDFQSTGDNTYQLKNLLTKKTFQPIGTPIDSVSMEEQPFVEGAANQQYEFIKVKKDVYLIKLRDNDLYLTPKDPKGSTNSSIVLAKKDKGMLQQRNIYLQSPTI